jgi:hypothetical protein
VSLGARALGSAARYPISAAKRQALIDWLFGVFERSHDDRVRSKCAATLLAADKLNLGIVPMETLPIPMFLPPSWQFYPQSSARRLRSCSVGSLWVTRRSPRASRRGS